MRFMQYVDCASETHNERVFCEYMERELAELGIPFERQELDHQIVTDGWNILAKVPGKPDKKPFLFVFHLDTVAPGNNVESYIENGRIQSRGNSVLGADGKLAIAVVMEAVSRLLHAGKINRPVEMLFTVCQELGLLGAKYADYSKIDSEEAIVIDHYVTGEVLMRTPSRMYLHVELIGQEAHVIRDPELGINALKTAAEIIHQIPTGQVSEDQTINIFDFVSLSQSNAIPKYARFDVEIRSFGQELLDRTRESLQKIIRETAVRMGCRYNIQEEMDLPETDYSRNEDMLKRLEHIYEMTGLQMKPARSFGILDATCTNRLGIRTIPIGMNIYYSHSTREYVEVKDIKTMLDLVENILQYF